MHRLHDSATLIHCRRLASKAEKNKIRIHGYQIRPLPPPPKYTVPPIGCWGDDPFPRGFIGETVRQSYKTGWMTGPAVQGLRFRLQSSAVASRGSAKKRKGCTVRLCNRRRRCGVADRQDFRGEKLAILPMKFHCPVGSARLHRFVDLAWDGGFRTHRLRSSINEVCRRCSEMAGGSNIC